MNVETILVPTDFSPDANQAVATATELAKLFKARVVLMHAYHLAIPMASPVAGAYTLPDGFYEELRAQATSQVEEAAKQLLEAGVEATGVAVSEPASMAIVAQAEALPAELIVMGTRGLSGLKHVALGSVAERVVRTAPCPVLTVKAAS
jgi:nucleotide-binding universal stress UspA family protein